MPPRTGKQVAVAVELKARFDEAANVRWANSLEEAGIHVSYGVLGLKTHSKVDLRPTAAITTACAATRTSAPATTTPARRACTAISAC